MIAMGFIEQRLKQLQRAVDAITGVKAVLEECPDIRPDIVAELRLLIGDGPAPARATPPGKAEAPRTAAVTGAFSGGSLARVLKAMQGKDAMTTNLIIAASGLSQPTVSKAFRENPTLFTRPHHAPKGTWALTNIGCEAAAKV